MLSVRDEDLQRAQFPDLRRVRNGRAKKQRPSQPRPNGGKSRPMCRGKLQIQNEILLLGVQDAAVPETPREIVQKLLCQQRTRGPTR